MRRALKLVLVIAVLLGLFGQTVALAAGPHFANGAGSAASTAMPADCFAMMKGNGKSSLPCDRMTLACVVGMGCVAVVAVEVSPTTVAEAMPVILPPATPALRILQGRSLQPEPHPPSTVA